MANRFGWKRPALPVPTPFKYFPHRGAAPLPGSVDITAGMAGVYDQGNLGSCTANAGSGLAQFVMKKTGKKSFVPSRLAIYYWNRVADGDVAQDNGSSLAQTMTTLQTIGAAPESKWWYNISKFAVKPSHLVVAEANKHLMTQGLSVTQDLMQMKSCLAEGWPFMFGFTVYKSFDNIGGDGIMPMPRSSEQILGGHAVVAVGYDDSKKLFKIRNSWSAGWGDKGNFYMPYDFLASPDYASDMWTSHGFQTWGDHVITHNIR